MSRRTSGEIVNATLLEIFLALTFLVLGFAVLQQQHAEAMAAEAASASARAADAERERGEASAAIDSLIRRLQENDRLVADLRDSINILVPPTCDQGEPLADVFLEGNMRVRVVAAKQHPALSHHHQSGWRGSISDLVSEFRAVGRDGAERGCRHIARIHSRKDLPLEEYQAAMRAVIVNFRTMGAFGSGSD